MFLGVCIGPADTPERLSNFEQFVLSPHPVLCILKQPIARIPDEKDVLMSTLRFLGKDPNSPQGGSPTLWVDEQDGSIVVQGWRLDDATADQVEAAGPVPAHETVVRIPARMLQYLKGL